MGLVIQYHYVGLGKQPVPKSTSDATGDVGSTDDLDDVAIEQGDDISQVGPLQLGPRFPNVELYCCQQCSSLDSKVGT